MFYYQKWKKDSFEYKYLYKLSKKIKENPNIKCYIGFDFGFFHGLNIYYGSNNGYQYGKTICENLLKNNVDIRLFCNHHYYNFDLIVLLGYSNISQERFYLSKKIKKIMKAFSFFS